MNTTEPTNLLSIAPSITCVCGHKAAERLFWTTPLGQELPPKTFQCPACNFAWTSKRAPEGYRDAAGDSPARIIIPIDPIL